MKTLFISVVCFQPGLLFYYLSSFPKFVKDVHDENEKRAINSSRGKQVIHIETICENLLSLSEIFLLLFFDYRRVKRNPFVCKRCEKRASIY
jgi:hypothetical protein